MLKRSCIPSFYHHFKFVSQLLLISPMCSQLLEDSEVGLHRKQSSQNETNGIRPLCHPRQLLSLKYYYKRFLEMDKLVSQTDLWLFCSYEAKFQSRWSLFLINCLRDTVILIIKIYCFLCTCIIFHPCSCVERKIRFVKNDLFLANSLLILSDSIFLLLRNKKYHHHLKCNEREQGHSHRVLSNTMISSRADVSE